MLILHRKHGEVLCIGDAVRVVVLDSDTRGVRLGIEAPPDVVVLREEIRTQIEKENRRASRFGAGRAGVEELERAFALPPDDGEGPSSP